MEAEGWGGSTAEPHIKEIKQHLSELGSEKFVVEDEKNLIMNMIYYFRKYKLGEGEIKKVNRKDVNIVLEKIITPDEAPAVGVVGPSLVGAELRPSPETASRSLSAHATQPTQQLSHNQESWLQNSDDF